MSNEYSSFSQQNEDSMHDDFPFPSAEATSQLVAQDMKSIFETNNCRFIDDEITRIVENIESTDAAVLDIIGAQMEKISMMHNDIIESTKRLFQALVNLKSLQLELISSKKQQTVQLLTKIENTIHSISKIE